MNKFYIKIDEEQIGRPVHEDELKDVDPEEDQAYMTEFWEFEDCDLDLQVLYEKWSCCLGDQCTLGDPKKRDPGEETLDV